MEESDKKRLMSDADGLATYEYIANHIGSCEEDMDFLIDNMARVDLTGQFVISAARIFLLSTMGGLRMPSVAWCSLA